MPPPLSNPNRRVIRAGPDSKKSSSVIARAFYLTLIVLAASLSALAVQLSRRLAQNQSQGLASSESSSLLPGRARQKEEKGGGAQQQQQPTAEVPFDHSGKYAKDRVYCMVPFIWNEEFYKVIMETWGKRCDVINFLTDAIVGGKLQGDKITDDPLAGYKPYTEYPDGTFPENVIFVNMTRPWNGCEEKGVKKVCRHIWEKMWRSWVYVEENHADQAEWFCKVDYDTFFFPDNLKYYVHDYKKWDPYNEYHYFGHLIQHRQEREPMIAGAAACWSVKTLHDIANVYRNMPKGHLGGERGKCEDRAHASEEVTTSLCLKRELDIDPYPARDDELREYITLAKYKDVLTWNRTEQGEWWFWNGKPKGAGQMEDCCAVRPIGLHKYKTVEEVRQLDQQFFGVPDNKEIGRLNARTKRYVMKVRKAMGIE